MRGSATMLWAVIGAAVIWVTGSAVRGDAIWLDSGGAGTNALRVPDVTITGIHNGIVSYQSSAGQAGGRDLSQVARIQIDDEPLLDQGEAAMTAGQWDAAVDALAKELETTGKPWLKEWIGMRLMIAGQKAGRFDAAADGYIALVMTDPALAQHQRLTLPDGRSSYITSALAAVGRAMKTPSLPPEAQQGLLSFQLDLQRAQGDEKAAGETLQQLLASGAISSADPAAAAQLARIKLQQAAMQLDKGDPAGATATIRSAAAMFRQPGDQAQALYDLAEAQAAIATVSSSLPGAWQDAAVAYMRVVAHFKDSPGAPLVALSLVKTAQIEQKLKNLPAARSLYEQVLAQYPHDPAAATARGELDKLPPAQ